MRGHKSQICDAKFWPNLTWSDLAERGQIWHKYEFCVDTVL